MQDLDRRKFFLGMTVGSLCLSARTGLSWAHDLDGHWLKGGTPPADTTATPYGAWLLRREFTVRGPVKIATLRHAALGVYETYLNARRIGNDVLAGNTGTEDLMAFQQHDVSSALVIGENAIGGFIGNGAYGRPGIYGLFRRPPLYWAQLDIGYADGSTDRIVTAEGWQVSVSPVTFNHISKGETWDARRQQPGWAKSAFTPPPTSQWSPAETVHGLSSPRIRLERGQYRRAGVETPLAVIDQHALRVIQLQKPVQGWAKLSVAAAKGNRFDLRFLDAEGKVGATDTYVVRDDGKVEVYEPHFSVHTFQTVRVESLDTSPKGLDVQIIRVES